MLMFFKCINQETATKAVELRRKSLGKLKQETFWGHVLQWDWRVGKTSVFICTSIFPLLYFFEESIWVAFTITVLGNVLACSGGHVMVGSYLCWALALGS